MAAGDAQDRLKTLRFRLLQEQADLDEQFNRGLIRQPGLRNLGPLSQTPHLRIHPATDATPAVWTEDEGFDTDGSNFASDPARMLVAARHHYEQMYRHVGGVVTGPRISNFIAYHQHLAAGAYSDRRGREIFRALGGLLAIAGVCAYDSDQQTLAEARYNHASEFAKASGDRAFGAYVHGLLVNQAVFAQQNQKAVELADSGLRIAGPHLSNALAADLRGLQAKAYARMNRASDATRCMHLAELVHGRIRSSEEPPETGYVQPGLIETQFAEALLGLGDLSAALEYAEQAVSTTTHRRGQVNRLVTLTRIAIADGQLEYAGDTVQRIMRLANGIESHRLRERIVSIRHRLARHASSHALRGIIEELDTRLAFPL